MMTPSAGNYCVGAVQLQALPQQDQQQQQQQASQVPAQQAEVVGQPSTLVKITVPTGAVPGQQINFTLPCGLRVSTSVQEHVQPGAMLTVAVPSQPAPATQSPQIALAPAQSGFQQVLLPQPQVSLEEADRQATQTGWIIYLVSFPICCCCSPLVAMIMWAGLAFCYFCKPSEERRRRPRQFAPACAAASTAGILCGCMLVLGLLAIVAFAICGANFDTNDPDSCPGITNATRHFPHHGRHGRPVFHDRPLFHGKQPEPLFAEDVKNPSALKILTEGTSHEPVMPIQEADMAEHMKPEKHNDVPKGPLHFGFKFDLSKGHILMT